MSDTYSESVRKNSNDDTLQQVDEVTSHENGNEANHEERNVLDKIFQEMGRWTKFQVIIQLNTMYILLTIGFILVLSFFTGFDPGWKCRHNNRTEFCREHFNETFSVNSKHFYQRCQVDFKRDDWEFITPKSSSFVTEFDLVCDKQWMSALISSSYFIGGLFGSVISGNLADEFGRKPVIITSILALAGSSVGSGFARNPWQLIGLNFFVGASCLACFFTAWVFQLEFISSQSRASASSLSQWCHVTSFLLMDLIGYYERYWRPLKLYTPLPCLLSLAVIIWSPESPRWLMSTGRTAEARNALRVICKINGNPIELNCLKSTQIEKTTYSYLDILRNYKILIFTLKVACIWFTLATVSYTLIMGSHNLGGNRYISFAITLMADIIPFAISHYLSNKFGRKTITLGGMLVSGVLLGCMVLVPTTRSWTYLVNTSLIFVARTFLVISFVVIYTWSFELFATPLRSQGVSVCSAFKTTGMILVPFITNLLQSVSRVLPFIIMSTLAVVTALVGISLPETNNKPTRDQFDDLFDKEIEEGTEKKGLDNFGVDRVDEEV